MRVHYPSISDPQFYQKLIQIFHQYHIKSRPQSFQEICFPKRYHFQVPQKFLAEYINPKTPYHGLLIYHRVGAGKSCTAISIAENFKSTHQIIVVLPASVIDNFRSEIRSECTGETYISKKDRKLLKNLPVNSRERREIIRRSNERIAQYYQIYSYNKFVQLLISGTLRLEKTLLIIDEVHNLVSEEGSYYYTVHHAIQNAPSDLRVVIMTATPIFDKPVEIALTMTLLLRDRQMPVGKDFTSQFLVRVGEDYRPKNLDKFKEYLKGYVSYFRGAPQIAFPREKYHLVRCPMSTFQQKVYRLTLGTEPKFPFDYLNVRISNNFYISSRMVSNIVFPNGRLGRAGFESLQEKDLEPDRLERYSPKFLAALRRIRRTTGTVFVYSNFREYAGIRAFARILEHYGYRNYEFHGPGKRRFAVWTGGQRTELRDEIKTVFNDIRNQDGSLIKIVCGSSALSEGVSFLRVQQIHILEPYWNFSLIEQVVGRGVRHCSHRDVPPDKRLVKVYIYLATLKNGVSIDQKIMRMALKKKVLNLQFERAIKETAIDCRLFYHANVYKGEPELNCS